MITNFQKTIVRERVWLQREIRKMRKFPFLFLHDTARLNWLYNELQKSYKFYGAFK